ncbi:hypothetical protein NKG94_17430 [Micromonospora sp. M12]
MEPRVGPLVALPARSRCGQDVKREACEVVKMHSTLPEVTMPSVGHLPWTFAV